MTRHRTFCRYCGAMTPNQDRVCAAHRDVYRAEQALYPTDTITLRLPIEHKLEGVPMRSCQACAGTGFLYPDVDCDNCNGLGYYLPPKVGEDVTPNKEMEA